MTFLKNNFDELQTEAMNQSLFEDLENIFFTKAGELIEEKEENEREPELSEKLNIFLKNKINRLQSLLINNLEFFNDADKISYLKYLEEISKILYPDIVKGTVLSDKLFSKIFDHRSQLSASWSNLSIDGEDVHIFASFYKYYEAEYINMVNFISELINKNTIPRLWNSNEIESLKQFLKLLLDNDFIDEIDEEIFINHFTAKPYSKKINWKTKVKVFLRLFNEIDFVINPIFLENRNKTVSVKELAKHFIILGKEIKPKNLTKNRNADEGNLLKEDSQISLIKSKLKKYFPNV